MAQQKITKAYATQCVGAEKSAAKADRPIVDARGVWDAWEVLVDMFGERFTKQFGKEPGPGWKLACVGLTREEIGRGLRHVIDLGREYPPAATTFRRLCKTPTEEEARKIRDSQIFRALPESDAERKARQQRAKPYLDRCWSIIGGKRLGNTEATED